MADRELLITFLFPEKDREDLFNAIPEGAFFVSDVYLDRTYIKPIQDEFFHLDTTAVSLDTGGVFAFSQIVGNSVYWIDQDGVSNYMQIGTTIDTDSLLSKIQTLEEKILSLVQLISKKS